MKKNNGINRILFWGFVFTVLFSGASLRANSSDENYKSPSLNIVAPMILGSITDFFHAFFFGHRVWEIWTGDHAKEKNSINGKHRLSVEEFQTLINKPEQEKIGMVWAVNDRESQGNVLLSPGPPKEKMILHDGKYSEKWIYPWAEVYFKNGKVNHVEFIQEGLAKLDRPVIAETYVEWK